MSTEHILAGVKGVDGATACAAAVVLTRSCDDVHACIHCAGCSAAVMCIRC